MPARIRLNRTKGHRKPADAIVVSRPTKWGNPFLIGVHGNQSECVGKYRECVTTWPCTARTFAMWEAAGGNAEMLVALAGKERIILDKLVGRDLACWCNLDSPCHADVLLELANP